MLRMRRRGGHRHGSGEVVGRREHRQVRLLEPKADAGFVAQLQAVRGEILTFRLRRVLGLARFDRDAHGREFGAVSLELFGERRLCGLVGELAVRIGVCLHSLGDLAGCEPLRECG